MGIPVKKSDHKFTYGEYRLWPEDERWELIEGTAYNMSPAPSRRHQKILVLLLNKMSKILEDSHCEVYPAPFDVFFPDSDSIDHKEINSVETVVQPDLSVICDPEKLIDKGCYGPPDLIIEILSPSTAKKDLNEKFRLYESRGVKEYWVVDPGNRYIREFRLQERRVYDFGVILEEKGVIQSEVFSDFQVTWEELFG
ncbi:Uma2 family endonuclease [Oceanispirochaeta sp.]|uniref:Uma2 family endonuclease n=1 Tax=Oceanispirochaeta sp. TaxID=2035350 RepID=UPI002609D1E3|nr:Uma2 family endonuclease [Oceanispirochaeta sp.]MDA3955580.1 Uma2 family endonuclease [Oceanispirochaeta sp.]